MIEICMGNFRDHSRDRGRKKSDKVETAGVYRDREFNVEEEEEEEEEERHERVASFRDTL